MATAWRRFGLTIHVTTSVAWIGSVACFLVLAIVGLAGANAHSIRGAYFAMDLTAWWVIVPLAIASTLSGIIQSLGTPWGLVRHYWVLVKLAITLPSTGILLLHMAPIGRLAVAAESGAIPHDLHSLQVQMIVAAGVAIIVLLLATVLSIYKPIGRTPYGLPAASPPDPIS